MIKELSALLKYHNLSLSSLMPSTLSSIKQTSKLAGLSNESYKLIFEDPQSPPLVIKFYKNLFPKFVNRKVESKVLNILNEANIIPEVYSNGDWGYSYKFVEGEELSHKDLNNQKLHQIVDTMIDMTMIVESTNEPE